VREKVHLHPPVDFNEKLVPWMRSEVDLFLCCHRQSDPSCTYLETLGCGVPIIGYGNRAWRGILRLADVGWMIPVGAVDRMVHTIIELDANRAALADKSRKARDFAKDHSFEIEFGKRVEHLRYLAGESSGSAHMAHREI
jgi:colanic acid/amylovoran biosynthesis glycosyltransferase